MQYIFPEWPAPSHVVSVSTTRLGGVSSGVYESFNFGNHVGDHPSCVYSNRALFQSDFKLQKSPLWLNQVHGNEILSITETLRGNDNGAIYSADGAITEVINQPCVVMTADCLPVLITDINGDQVCAIHAGWRGMAGSIIEGAVNKFRASPENLLAWCGPCIGVDHFEVGLEVKQQLGGPDEAYRPHTQKNKIYADLKLLAVARLEAVGVRNCFLSSHCTYADSNLFYSYRRDGQTGRMATLIVKSSGA